MLAKVGLLRVSAYLGENIGKGKFESYGHYTQVFHR